MIQVLLMVLTSDIDTDILTLEKRTNCNHGLYK